MTPIAAKIPFNTEDGKSFANRPIFNNPNKICSAPEITTAART